MLLSAAAATASPCAQGFGPDAAEASQCCCMEGSRALGSRWWSPRWALGYGDVEYPWVLARARFGPRRHWSLPFVGSLGSAGCRGWVGVGGDGSCYVCGQFARYHLLQHMP